MLLYNAIFCLESIGMDSFISVLSYNIGTILQRNQRKKTYNSFVKFNWEKNMGTTK